MPSTGPSHYKRMMKNYLIDRRYQLGWVARVALVVTIIVAIMGYFLYDTLSESIEMMAIQAMEAAALTEDAQAAIISHGQKDKFITGVVLAATLIGLVVVLSVLTIVVTHKVAGPVYKLKRLLGSVDGTHLQLWEKLRKGDELHDVFEEFAAMLRRLREARHLDIQRLESIIASLEQRGVTGEAIESLRKMGDDYRDSIRME